MRSPRPLCRCPLLLAQPLERAHAEELLRIVGVDGRGLISCARFNGQLNVLPPMPAAPAQPGCLQRLRTCVSSSLSPRKAKGPSTRYDEADLSDDGTSHDGMHPMIRVL